MAWLGIPSPLFQLKIEAEDEIPGPVQNAALQPQQQEIPPDQGQIKRRRRRVPSAEEAADKASSSYSAGKRSSIYRGVTRHRWTGRYEAHLWDKGSWNHSQNKRGKQVYLGAYDEEEAAARAYDLAALKYWGPKSVLNFPVSEYVKDLQDMQLVSKEEYLASLRRKSSGFSRGVSKYRGVARHHHNGRWEARIGRVFGNKYLYLGTYSTQEEAAAAYDMAAIEYRGLNAVTNFDLSRYTRWLRPNQLQLLLEQQQQQQQEQHHQEQLLQQQQQQEQHQQQQQNFNHLARQQEQQQQQQQGYSHSQLQEQHAWSRIPMLQHMSPAHQHPFLALACGSGSDDKDDDDNPNYGQNLRRTQMQASMMLEVINTPYCLSRMHNVNASYDEDETTQGFLSLGHGHAFGSSSSNPIVLP